MIAALKISHLEQLNNEIFALLPTRFSCLKIDHLVKQIGIKQSLTNPFITAEIYYLGNNKHQQQTTEYIECHWIICAWDPPHINA